MQASVVEQLMEVLIETDNRLKKFTLVNVSHSERSFERLVEFVEGHYSLKDLDLSW